MPSLTLTPLSYCYLDGAVVRAARFPSPIASQLQPIAHVWNLTESSDGSGAVTRSDIHGTNHLTDVGTVASTAGKFGLAANFTSDSEYLRGSDITRAQSKLMISGWLRMSSVGSTIRVLFIETFGDSAGTGRVYLVISATGTIIARWWSDATSATSAQRFTSESVNTLSANTDYHVAAYFDAVADTIRVYVNGVAWINASHPGMGAIQNVASAGGSEFGGWASTSGSFKGLGGRLERLVVANVVPSGEAAQQAHAQALYNSGNGSLYAIGQTSRVQAGDPLNDATAVNGWNFATLARTLGGSAADGTYLYQLTNNSGAAEDLTSASYDDVVALGEKYFQYLRLQPGFIGNATTDTLSAVSIDTFALDVTAPSDVSATATFSNTEGGAKDLLFAFNDATDAGGSGYLGAQCSYVDDATGDRYYEQDDCSWSTTNSNPRYHNNGNGAGRNCTCVAAVPATVTTGRITAWDNAGNSNDYDFTFTATVTDLPELSSILASATLDGQAGTLALSSVLETDGGTLPLSSVLVADGGTFDEAARNVDPGIDNVVGGTSYKIQNSTLTGTFSESSRNTDPGIANVREGTAYKILNVDKTGTLILTATAAEAGKISFGGVS